ncbi:MAG: hypothetical protein WCP06_02220 [Verrucomicrobiota bacterium]
MPVSAISLWLLIAAVALLGGMTWVYFKNQIHACGGEIKGLERELANLSTQNEVLRSKINERSSRSALRKRINDGFIKMIPITQDRIVQVNYTRPGGADEIRVVSNQKVSQ